MRPVLFWFAFTVVFAGAVQGSATSWDPVSIHSVVGNGAATASRRVVFSSSEPRGAIRFVPSESLQPIVRVNPSYLPSVEANRVYEIEIVFDVGSLSTGSTYSGTVEVVSAGRRRAAAPSFGGGEASTPPLTVTLDVDFGDIRVSSKTRAVPRGLRGTDLHVSPTSIRMESLPDEWTHLAAGDVIVLPPFEGADGGLLRKVVAVEDGEGEVVVQTSAASIADAIEDGTIKFSGLLEAEQKRASVAADTIEADIRFELDDVVLYDKDGNERTSVDQVRAAGEVSFAGTFDLELEIEDHAVRHFSYEGTVEEDAELTLTAGGSVSVFDVETIIDGPVTFRPIVIWAGYVPIVVRPVLDLHVGAEGKIRAEVSTAVHQNATVTAGVQYADGKWTPTSRSSLSISADRPTLTVSTSLKAFAGPLFELKFYELVGPTAELLAYLELDAEPGRCPTWWTLVGGIELNIGVKAEAFDFELAEWHKDGVADIKRTLATSPECASTALATPRLKSPPNGSVFNHFPRETPLSWYPVSGAVSYQVEAQYYFDKWYSDVVPGQVYFNEIVEGTSITLWHIGMQPGRWRVRAIGPSGNKSAWSGWWEFTYTV